MTALSQILVRGVVTVMTLNVNVFWVRSAAAASEQERSSEHRLIDVPYFAQTPDLCGGAALAMVLRYWGDRAVLPGDFQSLVGSGRGGILTTDLVEAARRRGWRAIEAEAPAAPPMRALGPILDEGRPIIALIEPTGGRFHYVVIVGITDTHVVLHDPAHTNFEILAAADFDRQWQGSGRWFLIVLPPTSGAGLPTASGSDSPPGPPDAGSGLPSAAAGASSANSRARDSGAGQPGPSQRPNATRPPNSRGRTGACGELVDRGVAEADTDTSAAERTLHVAAELCPGRAGPWLELAGLRFRARDWQEAATLAERAIAVEPDGADSADAWQLLGSARFLADDPTGAIEAWNHVGEPSIDVLTISGARRTPQPALMRLMSLQPHTVLSFKTYERAARRLSDAPTVLTARLAYTPEQDGQVAVSAAVAERETFPHQPLDAAVLTAHAIVTDEVQLSLAGVANQGELIAGTYRWPSARPLVGLSFAVPAPTPLSGEVAIDTLWERQTYAVPSSSGGSEVLGDSRRRAMVDWADWISGRTRIESGLGIDRFGAETYGALRLAIEEHLAGDRLVGRAEVQLWRFGPGAFSTRDGSLTWQSTVDPFSASWSGVVGIADATSGAPRALWMGAGTGIGRPVLLRAHPLLADGVIVGPMFGRRLVFQSTEYQHPVARTVVGAVALAAFVDAAQATGGLVGPTATWEVDAGGGLRLRLFERGGAIRLDVARGLRDGRMAVSVGWSSSGSSVIGGASLRNGSW